MNTPPPANISLKPMDDLAKAKLGVYIRLSFAQLPAEDRDHRLALAAENPEMGVPQITRWYDTIIVHLADRPLCVIRGLDLERIYNPKIWPGELEAMIRENPNVEMRSIDDPAA